MKRYWLFAYPDYYPSGGMGDCRGDFETIEEAMQYATDNELNCLDNCDVIDSQTGEIVAENQVPGGFMKLTENNQ